MRGAMTLSIMAFSITTFGIMTFGIMTLGTTARTISIKNATSSKILCRVSFLLNAEIEPRLNVVPFNAVMLRVVAPF